MPPRLTRRAVIGSVMAAVPFLARSPSGADASADVAILLADLESRVDGRLGVAVLDVSTGAKNAYRGTERFPMCSTFKFLAAAFVLARVDRNEEDLGRRVFFTEQDLLAHSPVTRNHTGHAGMSLAEICEAAMTLSDGTAGNLMLASFGGPRGLTAYARSLDDYATRLDRIEPELNDVKPGDPRDTTTPEAMLTNLQRIVLGEALSRPSRERMTAWLLANKTGDQRLRAGFPANWVVGDKTGTSSNGVTNDIAVVWPVARAPIIVTTYLAESSASPDERDAILANVARIITARATTGRDDVG